MHDEFQDLEAELKRLRPRAPSPELLARLERELSPASRRSYTTATTWRSWKWTAWTLATAAALAVMFVLVRTPRANPGSGAPSVSAPNPAGVVPVDIYKPVTADNVLYATREEGGVTLADGTPARRVRSQYVDTITWKNPRTNASVRWSIPRDEVRVVPVSFQ